MKKFIEGQLGLTITFWVFLSRVYLGMLVLSMFAGFSQGIGLIRN